MKDDHQNPKTKHQPLGDMFYKTTLSDSESNDTYMANDKGLFIPLHCL